MKETGPLFPEDIFTCGPPPHAKCDMLNLSRQTLCLPVFFYAEGQMHAVVYHTSTQKKSRREESIPSRVT